MQAIQYYENKYNIPVNLLHSIALVESGRYDKSEKKFYPWPWTANVEGKAYFFDNKQQAVRFVKGQMDKGKKNIDVGCNQINLFHHGDNFLSIDHAFNPVTNSHYAAKFLKTHFNESNNWILAVAHYHSYTPNLGKLYAGKVFTQWKKYLKGKKDSILLSMRSVKGETYKSNSNTKRNAAKFNNRRTKDDIIVFSKSKLKVTNYQKEETAVAEISERMLKKY
jgi:hypothetical protein